MADRHRPPTLNLPTLEPMVSKAQIEKEVRERMAKEFGSEVVQKTFADIRNYWSVIADICKNTRFGLLQKYLEDLVAFV